MSYSRARKEFKFDKFVTFWRTDYVYFLRIGRHQFDWRRIWVQPPRRPQGR